MSKHLKTTDKFDEVEQLARSGSPRHSSGVPMFSIKLKGLDKILLYKSSISSSSPSKSPNSMLSSASSSLTFSLIRVDSGSSP